MTDPIPATPGWVETRLDQIFADLPAAAKPAVDAFAACLARSKAPAAPSDLLGAEFQPCHAALRQALTQARVDPTVVGEVMQEVEALEAEVAADS